MKWIKVKKNMINLAHVKEIVVLENTIQFFFDHNNVKGFRVGEDFTRTDIISQEEFDRLRMYLEKDIERFSQ